MTAAPASRRRRWLATHAHWLIIAALALLLGVLADRVLLGYPHSGDEWAYQFQAQTFLRGRVVNPPLPDRGSFHQNHIIDGPRGRLSKYPPGWPAVLLLGEAVGAGDLVNPLLSALTLVLVYLLALRVSDRRIALVTLVLTGTAPFFLLNGACLFATPLAGLSTMAGLYALWRYAETPRARWAAAGCAALGVLALTRLYDAVLMAALVLPLFVRHAWRSPRVALRSGLAGAAVLAAAAALHLLYYDAALGSPWKFGHTAYDAFDTVHPESLWTLAATVRRLGEYGAMALPVWGFVLAAWLLRGGFGRLGRLEVGVLCALVVVIWLGYQAYPLDLPPRYGPRYVAATHPVMAFFIAAALCRLRGRDLGVVLGLLVAVQGYRLVGFSRALHHDIDTGLGLERSAAALQRAIAPARAVIVVSAPSGPVIVSDLLRNPPDPDVPIMYVAASVAPVTRWRGLAERAVYYWDGLAGPPVLWTADPAQPVQAVVLTRDGARIVRRTPGAAPEAGWLATSGSDACAGPPRDMPGLRELEYGPLLGCQHPGQLLGTVPARGDRTLAEASARGHGTVQLRGFLHVPAAAEHVFVLAADDGAQLRVDGRVVAMVDQDTGFEVEGRVRLEPGTHVISVSAWNHARPGGLAVHPGRRPGQGRDGGPDWTAYLHSQP